MKKKAYSAVSVKEIQLSNLLAGRNGQPVIVGHDVGKESIFAVLYWSTTDIGRPWKIANPEELALHAELLKQLAVDRPVRIGMEPTGTYGDPLRQALADAGLAVERVQCKNSHDHAETFDGVPSQHDGKDAAVVAELVFLNKSKPWPWPRSAFTRQMNFWVRRVESDLKHQQRLTGDLEGQLMKHWPELPRDLKLTSWTLLRILSEYGDSRRLAQCPQAADKLRRWSFGRLSKERIADMIGKAKTSAGVRIDRWSRRQLRSDARRALAAKKRIGRALEELKKLAARKKALRSQAKACGSSTACVLWAHLGDPQEYRHAGKYRKAMGLNLRERSSGKWRGQLRITKRGHSAVRRWLYFSALRWIRREPVRSWFLQKKAKNGCGKKAVVAVMRKLALGLHRVGMTGDPFEVTKLFSQEPEKQRKRSRRKRGRRSRGKPKQGQGAE